MYKHMSSEVFERFARAADAFAVIGGKSKWHSQLVLDFYDRYLDSFVDDCKTLPEFSTVVYRKGNTYGNFGNHCSDYIYGIYTRVVELQKVKISAKSIVFDDGYVLPFSKIKFFAW